MKKQQGFKTITELMKRRGLSADIFNDKIIESDMRKKTPKQSKVAGIESDYLHQTRVTDKNAMPKTLMTRKAKPRRHGRGNL